MLNSLALALALVVDPPVQQDVLGIDLVVVEEDELPVGLHDLLSVTEDAVVGPLRAGLCAGARVWTKLVVVADTPKRRAAEQEQARGLGIPWGIGFSQLCTVPLPNPGNQCLSK